ncbi:hypothetical protein R1flu_004771 [Riccia fluitans]|uniref:Uncharacterized protein n=1 Tax=Riccia fluitans TaxID=41844 RepID=A0ABD1YV88_9MARC
MSTALGLSNSQNRSVCHYGKRDWGRWSGCRVDFPLKKLPRIEGKDRRKSGSDPLRMECLGDFGLLPPSALSPNWEGSLLPEAYRQQGTLGFVISCSIAQAVAGATINRLGGGEEGKSFPEIGSTSRDGAVQLSVCER